MSLTETAVYFKWRFDLPDDLEKIKQEWMDMAREKYRSQVPLKPGAREFLEELRRRKIRTGIASSNGMEMIRTVLKSQQVENMFDSIHTCCEVKQGKPGPDIYQLVAGELQVPARECLVLEDVPMGILAGRRAGMKTCAVEDAASLDQREEKRRLADYYIRDFYDILEESYEVLG